MRIKLLPGSLAYRRPGQSLTTYLINDTVAIDAGSLGLCGTVEEQMLVKHVCISHAHLDHLASLPMFLDNVYDGSGRCPTIHATAQVHEVMRRDMFNDRIWPDFFRISERESAFLHTRAFTSGETFECDGLKITPVSVHHAVECVGFIVEDSEGAVVFSSDTGPTVELWERARQLTNLRMVFLEATFPNDLDWLAQVAGHLTAAKFGAVARALPASARIIAVHLHPRHAQKVTQELKALKLHNVEIGKHGETYVSGA